MMNPHTSLKIVRRPRQSLAALALGIGTSLSALASPTTLTVSPASITAGPAAGILEFPVTRTGDLAYDAYIAYRTANGTALAGTDYTATNSVVRFPAGSANGVLPVPIAADPGGNTLSKTLQLIIDNAIGIGPRPSFGNIATLPVGLGPAAIAVADFNGDGRPDQATANISNNSVSVLLNITVPGVATSSFILGATLTANGSPRSVAAGDFNGDGRPDLAVANQDSSTVSILFNNTVPGAFTASFAQAGTPGVGANPYGVAVGDFNGDGRPDLATANISSNTVSILLNATAPGAASASFTLAASPGVGNLPLAIAVDDFNGDGRPDVAVANNGAGNSVSILLNTTATSGNTTSASFAPAVSVSVGNFPIAVAAGDFNGDGRPDLAVVNQNNGMGPGNVSILVNGTVPGAGSAVFTVVASPNVLFSPRSVAVGDFNGDGKPDLGVANGTSNNFSVLLNTGLPSSTGASFTLQPNIFLGVSTIANAVGDFNGDGRLDVATVNFNNNTVLVLQNLTPPDAATTSFATATNPASADFAEPVVEADFNGDGKLDLAVAIPTSDLVSVLLNSSSPGNTSASFLLGTEFDVGNSPRGIAVGDFNGDGKPDLATANAFDGNVSVLRNSTPPGFAGVGFSLAASPGVGSGPEYLAVGDFNGDGKPDLAVSNRASNTVSILLNSTAPGATSFSFTLAASPVAATGLNARGVAVGDFNGDGKADLAVVNAGGSNVSILLNSTPTSTDTTSASFTLAASPGVGSFPRFVAVGDFNGDGRPDLAVVNSFGNTVSILLNTTPTSASTTSASFTPAATLAVGNFPKFVAVGDLNGDGKPDLAVTNRDDSTVSILLNTTATGAASASFTLAASPSVADGPESVAVGDVNGDGQLDLVTASNGSGSSLSVLLNTRLLASFAGSPATGSIQYVAADTTPTPFVFTPVINALRTTVYTSNAILVTGLGTGVAAPISVTGGSYSIGCTANFVTSPGTIVNGQMVCVRQTSSASFSTKTTATLSIGTLSAGYDVTTMAIDNTLDPISFPPVANAPLSSVQTSNAVALTGINTGGGSISVSGDATAQYCLNSNPCTSTAGSFATGDTVRLQVTASANPATTVTATLMVSGSSADFNVTTRDPTTTPTPFSFTPVTGAAPGAIVQSNSIVVLGLEAPAAISITGDASARFCINGNACTAMVGAMVSNGDVVKVQLTASSTASATVQSVLTIGSLSAGFSVTTGADLGVVTPSFTVSTSGAATSNTPVPQGAAGTYSFNARFCVNSGQLSQLFSQTTQLSNNNSLINRTGDGPNSSQPGGIGSTLSFVRTGDYADGTLSPGECITQPYLIGLATKSPFTFRIDLRGARN